MEWNCDLGMVNWNRLMSLLISLAEAWEYHNWEEGLEWENECMEPAAHHYY